MSKKLLEQASNYIENNIEVFHIHRIHNLEKLKLSSVIKRKNPYLFKTKNILTASEIVKNLLDSHLSSNEETIFGEWLEGLAIFINSAVYSGWKSGIKGIDLEFEKDNIRYIVNIKSGPNWGNSSQIVKMKADFNTARKILRTSNSKLNVIAVNGCCYGKDSKPDKDGIYFKYCGQLFWEFISGDSELYRSLIIPLGKNAKQRNEDFNILYANCINKFTLEFSKEFCLDSGAIDWDKLLIFNSGA